MILITFMENFLQLLVLLLLLRSIVTCNMNCVDLDCEGVIWEFAITGES